MARKRIGVQVTQRLRSMRPRSRRPLQNQPVTPMHDGYFKPALDLREMLVVRPKDTREHRIVIELDLRSLTAVDLPFWFERQSFPTCLLAMPPVISPFRLLGRAPTIFTATKSPMEASGATTLTLCR